MGANHHSEANAANDNTPLGAIGAYRHRVGEAAWSNDEQTGGLLQWTKTSPVRAGVRIHRPLHILKIGRTEQAPTTNQLDKTVKQPGKTTKPRKHAILFLMALGLTGLCLALLAVSQSLSVRTNGLLASGLGSLALAVSASARTRQASLSYRLAVSTASLALGFALWQGLSWLGAPNQAEVFALGLSTLALSMAALWKAPYFLNLSALMVVVWGGLSLLAGQFSQLGWLFPALWSVQMFLAFQFHIRRSILLCATAGVLWIGISALLTL